MHNMGLASLLVHESLCIDVSRPCYFSGQLDKYIVQTLSLKGKFLRCVFEFKRKFSGWLNKREMCLHLT